MAIKSHITPRTHASAVSKQLRRLGYTPYGANETRYGGYIVKDKDSQLDIRGGRVVRVSYEGIHRELKGPAARKDSEREKARLERMADMMADLKVQGYYVVWGWDVETGKTDSSFLAVSGSPARRSDVPEEEGPVVPQQAAQEPVEPSEEVPQESEEASVPVEPVHSRGAFPLVPLMTTEDAEEGVRTIQEIARNDPESARRMESHLYYLALVAVVSGSEDSVDVAATVLQTQGTLLPR